MSVLAAGVAVAICILCLLCMGICAIAVIRDIVLEYTVHDINVRTRKCAGDCKGECLCKHMAFEPIKKNTYFIQFSEE